MCRCEAMIPPKDKKNDFGHGNENFKKYFETGLSFGYVNGTMWWEILKIYVLEPKTFTIGCKDADI